MSDKVMLCERRSITEHVAQMQMVFAYSYTDMVLMNKAAKGVHHSRRRARVARLDVTESNSGWTLKIHTLLINEPN